MERIRGKMTPAQKAAMKQEAATADRQKPRLRQLTVEQEKLKPVQILLSGEMHSALSKYCEEHGQKISDVLRAAGMATIGRTDLLNTVRSTGRPKSQD